MFCLQPALVWEGGWESALEAPRGGRRRRVGNLHGKASEGDWIGGVGRAGPKGREGKVGAEPGAEREALGRRWRRTNPPRAAEGHFRGQRGRPCSQPAPTRDRDQASSGKAAADLRAAGGAAPVPGSASVPRARGRGRPGARSPRAFGGLGARLNCENRDALPARGDPAPRPNLCPGPGRGQPGRASNACPGSRSGPAHSGEPAGPELPTALHSRGVSPIPSLG